MLIPEEDVEAAMLPVILILGSMDIVAVGDVISIDSMVRSSAESIVSWKKMNE